MNDTINLKNKYRSIKRNKGIALVQFLVLPAILLLVIIGVIYQNYQSLNEEIPASLYKKLSDLSSQSCSGAKTLKSEVAAGPISYYRYAELNHMLNLRNEQQKIANERAKITNSTVACT
jgi:hypothetical protein